MNLSRSKRVAIRCSDFLGNQELVENLLEVLEIGHIAASADDSVFTDFMQALNILESCKRAVRCCSAGSDVCMKG
jgi:hypothetical protein